MKPNQMKLTAALLRFAADEIEDDGHFDLPDEMKSLLTDHEWHDLAIKFCLENGVSTKNADEVFSLKTNRFPILMRMMATQLEIDANIQASDVMNFAQTEEELYNMKQFRPSTESTILGGWEDPLPDGD